MLNGIDEEEAVSNFLYYKPALTGQSSDPNLMEELRKHIKDFTEEVSPENKDADAQDVD